ncbi:MAG: Jag N-terminal domain-containing protein, partial [Thermomicrobium sp.]|nr:Jag N-terminal domain-containing protein [Thermomicrobium sp.]
MVQNQKKAVEIQARSVDEAVRLALEQLGLPRERVHVEVLVDNVPYGGEALVRVTPLGSGEVARGPIKRPDAQTEAVVKQVVREFLQAMGFSCTVLAVDNPSIIELGPEDPPTV